MTKSSKNRPLDPMPLLDPDLLLSEFKKLKIKPIHAQKIWRCWIQHSQSYDSIPQIPLDALELLKSKFTYSTSKVISRQDARDGSTTKLLIELQDGQRIESVIMRYGQVTLEKFPMEELEKKKDGLFKSNGRATLCVSSQVGCSMGCTFCATGTMGLLSHLSCGEILEQLVHANKIEKIRNVVFMGMGEPLDNYQQVLNAIEAMTDVSRFGLSPSRISVSTVGVVPRMWSLIQDAPQIGLALSLHAPNQTLRTQIVPSSKAWHLDRIMEAMDAFIENQNQSASLNRKRHVLIEYVLIADVNDSEEIAHELGNLLQHRSVLLNVIPYNPTQVPFDYKSPSVKKTREFVDTVKSYGIHTLQRQELGQDIASACGQLVIKSAKPSTNAKTEIGDIEDLGSSRKKSFKMNKRQNSIQQLKQNSNFQARSSWEIGFLMILLISVLMYRWLS